MNTYDKDGPISCETVVGFVEGRVSAHHIPEEIISDISVSLRRDGDSFAQASRFVRIDEPFYFIVEPGSYSLECHFDQVKLNTPVFAVGPSERKVIQFRFMNEQ
ncbi:MAG: hypothetical protein RDV48_16720 [Candidatus Eremiobacteraeota bacterium]|nr:hypothetical protein [Candidatus Eremiobacteraeota bacterium]